MALRYLVALGVLAVLAAHAYGTLGERIERNAVIADLRGEAVTRALQLEKLVGTLRSLVEHAESGGVIPNLLADFRRESESLRTAIIGSLERDIETAARLRVDDDMRRSLYLLDDASDYVRQHLMLDRRVAGLLALDDRELSLRSPAWIAFDLAISGTTSLRQSIASMVEALGRAESQELSALKDHHWLLFRLTLATLAMEAALVFAPLLWGASRAERRASGAEHDLHFLARHDPMTGAGNRTRMRERFDDYLKPEAGVEDGDGFSLALLLIDLDDFKPINDLYGHHVGDQLLIAVVDRVRQLLRHGDEVIRYGGDEFVVLLPGVDLDMAVDRAATILDAIKLPLAVDERTIRPAASIGVAAAPAHGESLEPLLLAADLALYHGKREGKGRVTAFTARLRDAFEKHRRLEGDLMRALKEDSLDILIEPIVDAENGRHLGLKAQASWSHGELGDIGPEELITVAERGRLDIDLTRHVLEQMARHIAEWTAAGLDPGYVMVRSSAGFLKDDNAIDEIGMLLGRERVEARRLVILVTEHSVIGSSRAKVTGNLGAMRALGLSVALDDFGAGDASLSQLVESGFDSIEIGRVLVRDDDQSETTGPIVATIIEQGCQLGAPIKLQGRDTDGERLRKMRDGRDIVQGIRLSRKLDAAACAAYLAGTGQPAPSAPDPSERRLMLACS